MPPSWPALICTGQAREEETKRIKKGSQDTLGPLLWGGLSSCLEGILSCLPNKTLSCNQAVNTCSPFQIFVVERQNQGNYTLSQQDQNSGELLHLRSSMGAYSMVSNSVPPWMVAHQEFLFHGIFQARILSWFK